jgi:hypothetical protein
MALAATTALALAAPALAAQDVPIVENTCNADNQSGDDCVFTTIVKNSPVGIYVYFTSSPDMCSKITAHIGVADDPQPHLMGQDLLAPGQTGKKYFIGGNAHGSSAVYVHANGHTGGCNTGGLLEWAGTLHVDGT